MKTPERVTSADVLASLREFLDQKTRREGDQIVCTKCGDRIIGRLTYLSFHDPLLDRCAGSGKVEKKFIPYCPTCEEPPAEQGCIHDATWASAPSSG